MEKATIYDYGRLCKEYAAHCNECPLNYRSTNINLACGEFARKYPDKANEIILKWCEEHPAKTRQDKFLEMFPNAWLDGDGMMDLCPKRIDTNYTHKNNQCIDVDCDECKKAYWLAEVEENE